MAANPRTPEQLSQELENKQRAAEQQIESAAEQERQQAQAQGVSEQEVTKRVEEARTQEKNKLYPQLEALKDSIKEIQQVLRAEREEKETIRREAAEREETQRLSNLSETERILEGQRRLEEQLKEEREARLEEQKRNQETQRRAELKEYRRNAIQAVKASGEDLLEELVRGNTEEEIDTSITYAKARYTELAERFKAESGERTKRSMPRSTSPSLEALEEEELSEQLNNVDLDKYQKDAEYREKIQGELAGAYARAQGLQ